MSARLASIILFGSTFLGAQAMKMIEGKTYSLLENRPDVIPLGSGEKGSTPYMLDVYRAKDEDALLIGDYFNPQAKLKYYTIIYNHEFASFDEIKISKDKVHTRSGGQKQSYSYAVADGVLSIHDSKKRLVACTTTEDVPSELSQMNMFMNALKKTAGAKTAVDRRIVMVFALLEKKTHLPQIYLEPERK